jgi:hypothetical protein
MPHLVGTIAPSYWLCSSRARHVDVEARIFLHSAANTTDQSDNRHLPSASTRQVPPATATAISGVKEPCALRPSPRQLRRHGWTWTWRTRWLACFHWRDESQRCIAIAPRPRRDGSRMGHRVACPATGAESVRLAAHVACK